MNQKHLLNPLLESLRIPSVSTQHEYRKDMEKMRVYLIKLFSSLGFQTKILKGNKHDAVFAELTTHRSLPTVLIYGHYDVQPPDPLDEWKSPPFKPVIRQGEIYARGVADNKGQHMIHIMALRKLLSNDQKLKVNFKFLIEGEEEIGSVSIESLAKKYAKNLLKCDYLMVSDTAMSKGQPGIDIGLRGLVYTEISIKTAKHDLHSGVYGGISENPVNLLSHLISKLKDGKNRILIPGFYNDVANINADELKNIKLIQITKEKLIKEGGLFNIGGGEIKFSLGERKWTQPTLDVNGIWGGYQEEGSKTIIPAKAGAKISMRLVPNQDNDRIYNYFEKYVRSLLPKWVKVEIIRHADCLPYIAPVDHPIFGQMRNSLKKVYGKEPIYKRVSGSIGFVPIMAKALNVPVLMVGFCLSGSNIHAPNEHLNLENYFKGIEVMTDFYTNLDKVKTN